MIQKLTLFLILFAGLNFSANAQNFNKEKLDAFLDVLSAHDKSMGSLCISVDDHIAYQKVIGSSFLNTTRQLAATTETRYRIGSITKMFTGTMIFQLIDEGKLGLDSRLSAFFPQLPNAPKITIGEMLSHRSGLHNFTTDSLYGTYRTEPHSENEMLSIFQKQPRDFEPGIKFGYSNTNFVLLGYILEKITRKSYAENLQERVASKIGLTNTYVGKSINVDSNESYSYTFSDRWIQEKETDLSVPGGAGAIVSTPADQVHFISSLFAGKLVSQKSLEQMKQMKNYVGMAMGGLIFHDKTGYGHDGDIDAFSSMIGYFPADKLAIAYSSNGGSFTSYDVMITALNIYFNETFKYPKI